MTERKPYCRPQIEVYRMVVESSLNKGSYGGKISGDVGGGESGIEDLAKRALFELDVLDELMDRRDESMYGLPESASKAWTDSLSTW